MSRVNLQPTPQQADAQQIGNAPAVKAFLQRTPAQVDQFIDAQLAAGGTAALFKLAFRLLLIIGRRSL